MTANLIELRRVDSALPPDLSGLQAYLAQLVGEPFRFARVSYGDELTLHFGELRPARWPKLKNKPYGAYILGVRGSAWVIKSGAEPLVLTAGLNVDQLPRELGKPIRKEDVEANPLIQPDSRVMSVEPFLVKPIEAFGLQCIFSDGSSLLVLPTVADEDEPEDAGLPPLADWEVISPLGCLTAGPGPTWSFEPSSAGSTTASTPHRSTTTPTKN